MRTYPALWPAGRCDRRHRGGDTNNQPQKVAINLCVGQDNEWKGVRMQRKTNDLQISEGIKQNNRTTSNNQRPIATLMLVKAWKNNNKTINMAMFGCGHLSLLLCRRLLHRLSLLLSSAVGVVLYLYIAKSSNNNLDFSFCDVASLLYLVLMCVASYTKRRKIGIKWWVDRPPPAE